VIEPGSNPADDHVDSPPELQIARDLVRRAIPLGASLVVICSLIWGLSGTASSAYAVGIVMLNFTLAAVAMAWAARISPTMLMIAAMFGFFVRMGIVVAAVVLVQDMSWVSLTPMLITLLVTHLGLLLWETRYVSASLAYPGLKPHVLESKKDA
jgi:hypothetical protein